MKIKGKNLYIKFAIFRKDNFLVQLDFKSVHYLKIFLSFLSFKGIDYFILSYNHIDIINVNNYNGIDKPKIDYWLVCWFYAMSNLMGYFIPKTVYQLSYTIIKGSKTYINRGDRRGAMVNMIDYDIVVESKQ